MSNEPITATLGEFASTLVREISQSLLLAATDAPMVRVHTVRVRFGQPPGGEAETGDNSLITERYPFFEDGWEVEMEMDGKVEAQLAGQPLPAVEPGRPLLALFGKMPLAALKGIDTEWAKFFNAVGVSTIGELAGASPEILARAAIRKRSVKVWESLGKARMLELYLPALPPTLVDNTSLCTLQMMTPAEILAAIGRNTLSSREFETLMELLAVLAVAIDSKVLRDITLGRLTREIDANPQEQ